MLVLLLFLNVNSKNAVKLARETGEILHSSDFEQLESWFERLMTRMLVHSILLRGDQL